MAKGSAKKPKESKCRGSGALLEGRDWVRIGGSKWLREIAEKQGKHIPKEYAEKSGAEFEKERNARAAEAERAPLQIALAQEESLEEEIPNADAPPDEEPDASYSEE